MENQPDLARAESYSPPEGVRAAARRALKWIEEGKAGSGFTDTGRKRAADLARGAEISVATLKRMKSFFARHEVDKKATGFSAGEEGYPSPGRVAWDAWGGDAGQSWANRIVTEESSESDDDDEERAMPGEVKEGDFVSWYSPAGVASGRVEHVMLDGIYGLPDSNFSLPASPENPALAIRIYLPAGEGWVETEATIGKKMSDVTKINPLMSMRSEEPQMTTNTWKITIPVDRAEEQDGGLFLYGQASGPERDSHGTEMDPTAIQDFADQIVSRASDSDPLPYLDHHMKDGVLRELGEVVDGSVSSDYRLNIKVRLHPDNPAAAYLHSRIKRGKKYGMSIAGDGVQYRMIDDPSSGEKVIRFLKIKLKEISNTTRPSWVPSFGTVLARSIEGEEIGENMAEELVKSDATEVVENVAANESAEPVAAQVTEQTEAPVVEAPVAEAAPAAEVAPAVEAAPVEAAAPAEENGEVVERARIAKRDAEKLVEAFNALKGQLETLGVFEPDAPQAAAEAPVAKTEDAPADENVDFNGVSVRRDLAEAITAFVTSKVDESTAVLRETIEKQAEYIKKLEELPAGKLPAAVVREKFETGLPDLGSMSNEDKLKYALGNIYK